MKLLHEEIEIQRVGQFEEEEFGIGDVSIILEILRKRMYSNPIKTICQEIMSNARDAHREVGKANVPIEVRLPGMFSSNFIVRDFGPGISPERMKNVFIKYGSSTKRSDNIQTGGFGIGAKTPWAYSDNFCIVSITPEQDNNGNMVMVKRSYAAIIDESRIGRLICNNPEGVVTDEPQGTSIIIDVPDKVDQDAFKRWAIEVSRYWNPRPNIIGKDVEFPEAVTLVENDNFVILNGADYQFGSVPFAIVDGIPYPISPSAYSQHLSSDEYSLRDLPVGLKFNTGDVPLTASREQIDYDRKETSTLIINRLREVIPVMRSIATNDVASQPNLWEARKVWSQKYSHFSFLRSNVFWTTPNGEKVEIKSDRLHPAIYNADVFRYTKLWDDRLKVQKSQDIPCSDGKVLVIDYNEDKLIQPSRGRVLSIFKHFKGKQDINAVYVVRPAEERTATRLPNYDDSDWEKAQEAIKQFNENSKKLFSEERIDLCAPLNLMDFEKLRAKSRGNYRGPVIKLRRFDVKMADFQAEADFDLEEDEVEGYYVESYNRSYYFNGIAVETSFFNNILVWCQENQRDIALYAIPRRFMNKLEEYGNLKPFESFVEEEQNKIRANPLYGATMSPGVSLNSIFGYWGLDEQQLKSIVKKVHSKESPLKQYLEVRPLLSKAEKKITELASLANIFRIGWNCYGDVPEKLAPEYKKEKQLREAFFKRYPLLPCISRHGGEPIDLDEVAFYINTKDEVEAVVI